MLPKNVIAPSASDLEFASVLSLDPLLDYWRKRAATEQSSLAANMLKAVERVPELTGPIHDRAILKRHRGLLDDLMSVVLPPSLPTLTCGAAAPPLSYDVFYTTPRFQREVMSDDGTLHIDFLDWDRKSLSKWRNAFAYMAVARRYYKLEFPGYGRAGILRLKGQKHGIECYHQLRTHYELISIRPVKEAPILPPVDPGFLSENLTNLDMWRKLIPPGTFEFYGMSVYETTDITESHTLSSLKKQLVEMDASPTATACRDLQSRFRNLLNLPDLEFEVGALDGCQAYLLSPNESCLRAGSSDIKNCGLLEAASPEALERLCKRGHLLLSDLATVEPTTELVREKKELGNACLLLLPLFLEDRPLGVLCLSSPTPESLNAITLKIVEETRPLLAMAVKRAIDHLRAKVQSTMKEKFTVIHPAIEWRFEQAALRHVQSSNPCAEIETIVFRDVYPLHGISDIRSSSKMRDRSIQRDLARQLGMARKALKAALDDQKLDFLGSREYRIGKWEKVLEQGLHSGDATRILEFLREDIEPLFEGLEEFDVSVRTEIVAYRKALDPVLKMLYGERKKYEESVSRIREVVSTVLYQGQREAQKAFPHYFEMYKTDGVDHTIYIGQSLSNGRRFRRFYLQNLRLWQLKVMAEAARQIEVLNGSLSLPLGTTHLILAHEEPFSIRFTQEEKQFNVDGAYNSRYEIIKKRIDKAEVLQTGERLTQPGTIVIAYSHAREAVEYRDYIEYLQSQDLLQSGVESLELAPMAGAEGMKALRVAVK